jgi:putative ABC transport system permease protein
VNRHSLSLWLYRRLLGLYPEEFRVRFGSHLESDFLELLARQGPRAAWRRVVGDLANSVRLTHQYAHSERRRVYAMSLGGERPMGSVLFDLRHAVRSLWKAPVFTAVTVLTLALGIGANAAIFSLVNAALLRPMGYESPDRLMMIHEAIPESKVPRFGVSPADYLDLVQYQRSFTGIGVYRSRAMELSGTGEPEQVDVAQMSASVLPILGVNAADGRTFAPDEDQAEASVVAISHAFAERRFAGRSAVGERLILDRRPYTIVGVMPASFEFPKRGAEFNAIPADVYMPLVFNPFEREARGMFYNHSVVGRLREGMTATQAALDTSALAARVTENYPAGLRQMGFTLQIAATPFVDEIAGQVRRPLLILLGAVGLVLLVACANVANLIVSRSVTRQREIGVRVALGAANHRLFQLLLLESLLLAFAGGAAGLVLSQWAVRAMPAVIASSLPAVTGVGLDLRVVGFTFGLSLATAVVFGLVPLASGLRRNVGDTLREGARTTGGRMQHRMQKGLVVSSVAFAFVLLVAAGLLIRSFANLMAIDAGVRGTNVLSMEVTLPLAGYNQASRVRSFYQTVQERLGREAGVRAAVVTSDLPVRGDGERRVFTPSGYDPSAPIASSVAVTWVYGDYFSTFGVSMVRGRSFTADELQTDRKVAIVSRVLADRYWPGEDPIGKQIKWGGPSSTAPWQTVIGVAGDVVDGPLGDEPVIHIYVPYAEVADEALAAPVAGFLRRMTIAVAGNVDETRLASPMRAAVAAFDPSLALAGVTTLREVLREATAPQRFSAMALGAFAGGALALAGIGLYGVLAFGVSQRTREIGVRLALGAGRGEVIGLVVRQGLVLTTIGLVVGALGAVAAVRVLGALLFETAVYDPFTFAIVPALLGVVSLAACYVPARRASRIDPTVALRSE